jgi:hypothetical protein
MILFQQAGIKAIIHSTADDTRFARDSAFYHV